MLGVSVVSLTFTIFSILLPYELEIRQKIRHNLSEIYVNIIQSIKCRWLTKPIKIDTSEYGDKINI